MPILGITASSILGSALAGSYESISTVDVTSNTASVTFSSIPATYKHLQIRGILRASYAPSNTAMRNTFNSDTGNNYTTHDLTAVNSSVNAGNETGNPYITFARGAYAGLASGVFTSFVMDILDYANTSKYKTVRTLTGYVGNNSEGQISLRSGAYLSTNAISSINMLSNVGDIVQYSKFALYGIK